LQLPALIFLQFGLISLHQLYPGAGISPVDELRGLMRSTMSAFLCLSAMNLTFGQLSREESFCFVVAAAIISIALPLTRQIACEILSRTGWWGIRVVLVGSSADCKNICARIKTKRSSGFVLVGYVSDDESNESLLNPEYLGHIDDAFAIACCKNAPVAAVAPGYPQAMANRLTFLFPSMVWIDSDDVAYESSDALAAFTSRSNTPFLQFIPRASKRLLDLALVVPGLIILAPAFALIAIAIKLRSPGPVFYGPLRIGQHGHTYRCWKFRSMVIDADKVLQEKLCDDPAAKAEWDRDLKLKDDPRIISGVGNLIRRWSLDELPQLWNVLVGQMSLIGPRPIANYEIVRYQKHFYEYTQMLPGITGLWQVSGRNDTTYDTRVFLVHHYAANWSMWLDAWILVKTPITVLTRRGAY
jgi:Undecaprenyl-phosphate galactose phosphotransferase WbaP